MAEPAKGGERRGTASGDHGGPEPEARDRGHVCTVGFCPICLAVTAVQPLKPDAVEHLLNAGREFLLAMTAVLGARADEAGGKEKAPTLTRIDIE
jgi:hypothetical protein